MLTRTRCMRQGSACVEDSKLRLEVASCMSWVRGFWGWLEAGDVRGEAAVRFRVMDIGHHAREEEVCVVPESEAHASQRVASL